MQGDNGKRKTFYTVQWDFVVATFYTVRVGFCCRYILHNPIGFRGSYDSMMGFCCSYVLYDPIGFCRRYNMTPKCLKHISNFTDQTQLHVILVLNRKIHGVQRILLDKVTRYCLQLQLIRWFTWIIQSQITNSMATLLKPKNMGSMHCLCHKIISMTRE